MSDRGTAVVAEVAWVNGLAAIRSLGRRGLRVLALDHRPYALGFRSRYAEPRLAPDPLEDEDGFVAALRSLAEETDDDALPVFPTHDEHVNAIARHADVLADRYRFPFPSWDVLERIQSKRHQLETAESVGLPVPRTFHPTSRDEALAAGEELGFPVLVKPSANVGFRRSHRRQLFRCESAAELESAYEAAAPHEPMVQELIPGGDEELYTLGSYVNREGEALGLFSGHKLSQTRGFMGSARVGEALWVEEVVEQGLAFLRALGFHGISQVETKRDPRDGRYKLMEVNPRLWQWHSLAAACGVDLPYIAYRDLVGEPLPPARMYGDGKRWAITLMAGSPLALERPPYVDAVFARDDPKPALVQLGRFAHRGIHRLKPVAQPSGGIRGS
jgi:predicted ATP-grasp superfamily ATP-dependent carboligase